MRLISLKKSPTLKKSISTSICAKFIHMSTQFLTDEQGQKVAVVIPIAEYEHLMEDVADLAAIAERRDEERIPLQSLKLQLIEDGLLSR